MDAAESVAEETKPYDRMPSGQTPVHARRADALVELAESRLSGNRGSSTADRYNVVVHVSAETLRGDEASRQSATGSYRETTQNSETPNVEDGSDVSAVTSHLEDGPHVTAVTSRRLACDGAIVALLEDSNGIPLSIGRKSRTIPPGMRRALSARDGGCRFPGCTHTKFVDGHHIQHWANGGETSLDNLVLLCRHHHRLVHEGGFGCEKTASGEVIFTSPDKERLPCFKELPGIATGEDPVTLLQRHLDTSTIDAHTCRTHCYAGDRMDWDLAVSHLV